MALFLTEEWAEQFTAVLNSSDAFKAASADVDICIQQHVVNGPSGDTDYYLQIKSSQGKVAIGIADDADVTATEDYETAAALAKGDLGMQNAFMQGRIKIRGDLGKITAHQGALASLTGLRDELEVDYEPTPTDEPEDVN